MNSTTWRKNLFVLISRQRRRRTCSFATELDGGSPVVTEDDQETRRRGAVA
ncbi:BnaC03g44810D [Brassica napus]|uniref:(rape) hypothetical protein n=1 Tax=Brassica napus TaxID=3708 RepID=A0A078FKZ8_BRANA|nr:unnamed protein product [Brassica napus]CDY15120.1 BnaC03g44810D [Brassica napus]